MTTPTTIITNYKDIWKTEIHSIIIELNHKENDIAIRSINNLIITLYGDDKKLVKEIKNKINPDSYVGAKRVDKYRDLLDEIIDYLHKEHHLDYNRKESGIELL